MNCHYDITEYCCIIAEANGSRLFVGSPVNVVVNFTFQFIHSFYRKKINVKFLLKIFNICWGIVKVCEKYQDLDFFIILRPGRNIFSDTGIKMDMHKDNYFVAVQNMANDRV